MSDGVLPDEKALLAMFRNVASKMGRVHGFSRSGGDPPNTWWCGFDYVTEEERVRHFGERMQRLIVRYQEFPHYEDSAFIAAHARLKGEDLLRRRTEILKENDYLHLPIEFVDVVRSALPHIYERALWEVRALALAERYAVEPELMRKPEVPARKETQDEWLARQLRHRAHLAKTSVALAEAKAKAIAELEGLALPGDEHERRLSALDEFYADPDSQQEAFFHGKQI